MGGIYVLVVLMGDSNQPWWHVLPTCTYLVVFMIETIVDGWHVVVGCVDDGDKVDDVYHREQRCPCMTFLN